MRDLLASIARRSLALRLAVYLREANRLRRHTPDAFDASALARQFPNWQRSQRPSSSPLKDEQPWITYPAIRFVEGLLRPDMSVFEWGSGGSTIFLARRVKSGISVEHDPAWGDQVRTALQRAGLGWKVEVVAPEPGPAGDPSRPEDYASGDPLFRDQSFRRYARVIDRFPDEHFDVVLIDGRARPACASHATAKVKRGGWMILDNAERAYYTGIAHRLSTSGWRERAFPGPGPYNLGFWKTCAWQRPG